jgi:hypothetical protein
MDACARLSAGYGAADRGEHQLRPAAVSFQALSLIDPDTVDLALVLDRTPAYAEHPRRGQYDHPDARRTP